jgi:hypothetical protein
MKDTDRGKAEQYNEELKNVNAQVLQQVLRRLEDNTVQLSLKVM